MVRVVTACATIAAPQIGWRHVLIKGCASVDPIGVIEAEIVYGHLIRAAGITTSPMYGLQGAGGVFFCTERFDRPERQRLHRASVAGLLDIGMTHGVIDYMDLIRMSKRLGGYRDAEEVFRRMVFNVRAFNRDDHVSDHAF